MFLVFIAVAWLNCLAVSDVITHDAGRHINTTADMQHPDPRSVGRVPPYQGPASAGGIGGFRPNNPYSRVEPWHHRSIYDQSRVVNEDFEDSDDGGCHVPCPKNRFSCQIACTCIPMEKRCDGVADCSRSEDEQGCASTCDEVNNRTLCVTTNVCISRAWICDGEDDCGDFSDETHCESKSCEPNEFECANGLCIHKAWVCDGDNDCRDNTDEMNCTKEHCRDDQFMCMDGECISLHWKCDLEADCADKSDETQCPVEFITCSDQEYQCHNKKCIRKDFVCDGDNDCGDWTDEDSCQMLPGSCNAGEYKCSDGKCIPERWRCDEQIDCSDGGDERNCDPQSKKNCSTDEFTCQDKRCILKTWVCDGVRDCLQGEDEINCEVNCEADQYKCKIQNNAVSTAFANCLNKKHVCDGIKDCPRGDDEEDCPIKRPCTAKDKCEKECLTTFEGLPACACPIGFILDSDGFSCRDIDECQYDQDPVCSQTCSNTVGSYRCGCMTGYVLRPDKRSCKATGVSPTLIFSNRIGIRQVWLTGDNYMPLVKGLHNAVALDYHYEKKLLFWSENNLRVIRVAQINNNNSTDVIRWGLERPGGIAVDWIHNLLFWTDSGTRRVEVSTLDGNLRAVIVANDLDKPRAIAVHPGDALVFWTDWGPNPKIERADMDGINRKTIVSKDIYWPNGLTLDYVESRIYWADVKHHVIEKCNFEGRDRVKVANKGLPHPFALTLFEDALYWTDWHTKSISTVNKRTGKGIQTVHAGLNVPMDIHSYHPLRQLKSYKNRCGSNNGGCSHLCLPNSIGYSCHCPVGYNLNRNGRSCESIPEQLLLYARSKDLRLKQLNSRKPTDLDMVIPVESIKSAVALDWDHNSNSIFWSDVEKDTINRAYLNGSQQTVIVGTNLVSPAGLAYDWVTDKIYWTDAGSNRIEVASSDGSMRSLLAWENIDKPRDIVVDPKGGLMYWSDWGSNPCIERADMDGGNRIRLISGNMTWPNGLALDLTYNRIYWTDGGNKVIEYANLDGTGRTVLIDSLVHPFGLDLYGNEVFWTDWETQSIQAADKITGKNRRTLGSGVAGLRDVRVFYKDRKAGSNRCSKHNGGCSHLCLLKPNARTCACPLGIKLHSDGMTCHSGPQNYLIFAHRNDVRIISLDVPYFIDVIVPLSPVKNALAVDVDSRTGLIYWSDTGEKKIQRADLFGKQNATVVNIGLHAVDGLVIDDAGRKLYWTDGGRSTIEVSEMNGSNRKVLISKGLQSPRGLALHYELGIMFWSDWGNASKIERADMDGNNRRILVNTNIRWPNNLAIDKTERRLYWNDAKMHTIESIDFDGQNRKTVISEVPYPYGLVLVGSYIYWTDWKSKAIHRADRNNVTNSIMIRENLEGLMDIRLFEQGKKVPENVCGRKKGGCSHLCLRSPQGYTCACPTGLKLENDTDPHSKTCQKHPNDFLVFATRNTVSYISLDTPDQWDAALPVSDIENSIAVDFHWARKEIYFTDVGKDVIRCINMDNWNDTRVVIKDRLETSSGVAIDWIADNIYWTDDTYDVVEVARLDGTSRKALIKNVRKPRAIAVFPAMGYLFWTDWSETPSISRSLLDGSERLVVVDRDLGFPNGITIDHKARKIYWSDAFKEKIDTADLDGKHRVNLVADAKHPFGMTVYKNNIYWTDWFKKSILRADKKTGKNITVIRTDLEMTMDIKAVSAGRQRGWNPCREDNGGCTHLCFYRKQDYICECPDEVDSIPCSTEPLVQVDMKMPAHYPSYFDYPESDLLQPILPHATLPSETGVKHIFEYSVIFVVFAILISVLAVLAARYKENHPGDLKDDQDPDVHMSFNNPNYAGMGNDPNDRRHRFQGIFKYERSQDRVVNVYTPEGTSLLPLSTPGQQPSPTPTPRRPDSYDDFETVTLHPLT